MSDALREPITTHQALARLLADFLVWVDHPLFRGDDLAAYVDYCGEYIAVRDLAHADLPPAETAAWCDLCGQPFAQRPTHRPEAWTGNYFWWCPGCTKQQAAVLAGLGRERYRARWEEQIAMENGNA